MRHLPHKYTLAILFTLMLWIVIGVNAQSDTEVIPDGAGLLPEFNRWRTAIGIRPYQEDVRLSGSTQFHADDMANRNYYAHEAPSPISCGGEQITTHWERAECFGTFDSGEGIATGYSTTDHVTRGWVSSYGHCLGVMNPNATHMGGGVNGKLWVFQFNGVNEPDPPIDSEAFCECTKGNDSESHIQSCVTQFNQQFNNGETPVVPPPSSLQLTRRIPSDRNQTLNNTSSGAQTFGNFIPGTLTIRVVPVTGNPSGINLELADGKFNRLPDQTGVDTLTYEVTEPADFSVWFSTSHLAQGDTFYIDIVWEDAFTKQVEDEQTATTEPTTQPVVDTAQADRLDLSSRESCSSGGTGREVTVTAYNNTSDTLSLAWISFDCEPVVYATLAPNTMYIQSTYDGHEWAVLDPSGTIIEMLPATTNTDITVDPSDDPSIPYITSYSFTGTGLYLPSEAGGDSE
jgi:hypothetical protein